MSGRREGWGERPRTRLLTPTDLAQLDLDGAEPLLAKAGWARAAMVAWGFCGIACADDGQHTGVILVSPALHVPRDHPLAVGANADAAALLAVVDDGCGRRLVPALAARLVGRRTIVAIDAAGSAEGSPLAPSYDWLDSVGFHELAGDPDRFRLELRGTRSWLPDLGAVVDRLRALVRPASPPEPVGRYERSRP